MKNCIVILNYNDSKTTLKYVGDIREYKILDKIIIVDNGSTDDSYEKLKRLQGDKIEVLKTPQNKGYGAGNNFGCKYAIKKYKNPIIFISNPDVYVEENTFKTISNYLQNSTNTAIVAPNIHQDGQIERGWKLLSPIRGSLVNLPFVYRILRKQNNKNYFYSKDEYKDEHTEVDVVTGCFFAIKGKVMEQIGYFDENVFLYNEEEIIARKIKDLGLKTVVLNDLNVIHQHSVSINKSFSSINKIRLSNKSKIYYQKHYNNANELELILWHCVNVISIIKECIKIVFNKIFGGKNENK